jgi:hypothetical protein
MKYSKRIKTYYGIPVPPWRHNPVKKSITFVFVIKGRIPSKKNELVAVVDRTDAFKFLNGLSTISKKDCITMLFKTYARIKNSLVYEKWEADTVEVLKNQLSVCQAAAERNGLIFPLTRATITTKFYWKDKHRRDNSNKSEGLHDALVKAYIILDDSDKVIPDTNQGARDYSGEVVESIAVIYVTAPIE